MFLAELRQSFAAHSSQTALEFPHRRYSFGQLERSAERVAGLLQSKGVAAGDRVLLCLEAKEPFLLGYLGALWCGAVPLPIHPGFKLAELIYLANDSEAGWLLHDATSAENAGQLSQQFASRR